MADLAALKAELQKGAYTGLSNSAAADALIVRAPVSVDITWETFRDTLIANGDWGTLAHAATLGATETFPGGGAYSRATKVQAQQVYQSCCWGKVLKSSQLGVRTALGSIMTALSGASVGAISAASITALTTLATAQQSPAEAIGWAILHDMDAASRTTAVAAARAS